MQRNHKERTDPTRGHTDVRTLSRLKSLIRAKLAKPLWVSGRRESLRVNVSRLIKKGLVLSSLIYQCPTILNNFVDFPSHRTTSCPYVGERKVDLRSRFTGSGLC